MNKLNASQTLQTAKADSANAPSGILQRKCASCNTHTVAGDNCDECANKEGVLQRKSSDDPKISKVPPIVHEVLISSGQPLDANTRAFMEPRFSRDFSHVRIHTDAKAAESAQAVNALAYTIGQNIVFNAAQYAPHSGKGRQLIAHELTHTIQQSGGLSYLGGETMIGAPNTASEREANRAAEEISKGSQISLTTQNSSKILQKQAPSTPEELAGKALKAGPKDKGEKSAFEKAEKVREVAEKSKLSLPRVAVTAEVKHEGVKPLSSSAYTAAFNKCSGKARAEAGLPQAFLCAKQNITPPDVTSDDMATVNTNVRLGFKKNKGGGLVWVTSASLPWVLSTAGYLNIDVVDTKMLKPYENHEKGHRAIAVKIHDRLTKLIQVELEGALPTEKKPLSKSGQNWGEAGIEAIISQISKIQERYMKWLDELADAADAAWDVQEKETLSKIAAAQKAKAPKPGSSVPEVPED
ncbi:MAG TPA: DUF4157 domain-containing protein [Pyrinomonadaceae bacterium]|jgi:hypothetical protein